MNEWIKIEDRLPEAGILVLVCWEDGDIDTDMIDKESGTWRSYSSPPTHWMYFPDAPDANKKDNSNNQWRTPMETKDKINLGNFYISFERDDDSLSTHFSQYKYGIITRVEILQYNKVVRVTFWDMDVQKAVCSDEDEFDLGRGIEVCLLKHFMHGTKNYNNQLRKGIKCYQDRIKAEIAELEEQKRILLKKMKRAAKKRERSERRAAEEREEQIQIQAEAIVRAREMMKDSRRRKNE